MTELDTHARNYLQLGQLEPVLNDLGIDTRLVERSEEFELSTLVGLMAPDEEGRDRFFNLTFMPVPEDEVEYVDLLQLYTSYPFEPAAEARGDLLELIAAINPRLPFGHVGVNSDDQIYYRYVVPQRRFESPDTDAVGETVQLFLFAATMFALPLETVATGQLPTQDVLARMG